MSILQASRFTWDRTKWRNTGGRHRRQGNKSSKSSQKN